MVKYLIKYNTINYIKEYLIGLIAHILIFVVAFVFLFIIKDDRERANIWNDLHIYVLSITGVILLILVKAILEGKVYIYEVTLENKLITIKWQEFKKICETTVSIHNINFSLVPYGKNNPYLKITIKELENTLVLKQRQNTGWDKDTMIELIDKVNEIKLNIDDKNS